MNYDEARNIIIENISRISSECLSLSESEGRIFAGENILAKYNIPSFERSPYDGYAFRSDDTENTPVTLKIIKEFKAGDFADVKINSGEAVKILTGAMLPEGADAVVKYEDTKFSDSEVTIYKNFKSKENVIQIGEELKAGNLIISNGEIIDSGKAGILASQNISLISVYRKPLIGIISTGNEIQDLGSELSAGKIYNTNRYTLETALKFSGFIPKFISVTRDNENEIADLIMQNLDSFDALILTGGVSVGDYDKIPESLKRINAKIIVRDVALKPGGKCVYAIKNEKLICCLSGNPASALTNYYAIALPALKKLSGLKNFMPQEIDITLENSFDKKSPSTRIIRGNMIIKNGKIFMHIPAEQGNSALSSMSGSNIMAVIPAGSQKLPPETILKGFFI